MGRDDTAANALKQVGKRAAGSYFLPTLFGARSKRLVRFLRRFG